MTPAAARAGRAARLPRIGGLVFDVDGTLLLSDRSLGGYEVLPGAIEALSALKERAFPFVLLTNGSAYPPAEQAARLRKIGLPVADEQMITPSSVTADHMASRGIRRVLVLGTPGVGHALREAGVETVHTGGSKWGHSLFRPSPRQVQPGARRNRECPHFDAVYVGWHPDCGMKDIEAACHAIWAGATLYVASNVPFFATREGRAMGYSYAIAGAIRRVTRARPILTGKPSLHALRFAARRLRIPVREIGVVGDDPLVEAAMARRGGAVAFGVTTGVTTREAWARQPASLRPHRVIGDLRAVLVAVDPRNESRVTRGRARR